MKQRSLTEKQTRFNYDKEELEKYEKSLEIPDGVMPIAWWTLWGEWDPLVDFDIENNEGNLASLLNLENIPEHMDSLEF